MEKISNKNESQIIDELKEIKSKKFGDLKDGTESLIKINNFVDENLSKTYSRDELQKIKLFHILIGSSYKDEASPNFDLPNGEIESFIRNDL